MRHPVDTEEVLKTCPVYTRKKMESVEKAGTVNTKHRSACFCETSTIDWAPEKGNGKWNLTTGSFFPYFPAVEHRSSKKRKVKKGFADDHTILSSNCMDYQAVLTHIMITVRIYAYAFIHKYFSIISDGKKIKDKISLHVGGDITPFLVGHRQMARKSLEGKHFIAFLLIL